MSECHFPLRSTGLQSTLLPDGYLVIADPFSAQAVTLNPLGALIWEFCDGRHSIEDILVELTALGVDVLPTLDSDVRALISDMKDMSLLTLENVKV
jgi:hypothetical protein